MDVVELMGNLRPRKEEPMASFTEGKQHRSELIQKTAYDLYLERGSEHGQDVNDWLNAEKIVDQKREKRDVPAASPGKSQASRTAPRSGSKSRDKKPRASFFRRGRNRGSGRGQDRVKRSSE